MLVLAQTASAPAQQVPAAADRAVGQNLVSGLLLPPVSQPLLSGVPGGLFRPVAGASGRPEFVWLPRGGGRSCNEAVGLLDGTVKEVHRS